MPTMYAGIYSTHTHTHTHAQYHNHFETKQTLKSGKQETNSDRMRMGKRLRIAKLSTCAHAKPRVELFLLWIIMI